MKAYTWTMHSVLTLLAYLFASLESHLILVLSVAMPNLCLASKSDNQDQEWLQQCKLALCVPDVFDRYHVAAVAGS